MNRTFTTREKALILVLAVLLLGCCYYLLVLKPSLDTMQSADARFSSIQDEMLIQQTVAARKADLEQQIAQAEADGKTQKTLPSYDNTKNEIAALDSILSDATSYNIDFQDAETSGTLVRRGVNISFTTDSYTAAQAVLQKLINCQYSCLVTDLSVTGTSLGSSSSKVTASASAVFFETL